MAGQGEARTLKKRIAIIGVGCVSKPISFAFQPRSSSDADSRSRRLSFWRTCWAVCRGASNSGKTTLAKHLRRLLKNSTIIHLDDFAPVRLPIPSAPGPMSSLTSQPFFLWPGPREDSLLPSVP